ncbi:hypothetical protein ANCDUO_05864 [Ancylostoma duodenale]|uniref:Peptidase M12A domain-containing protein n=1 Tax=Ancylostoma duodenale TaxID=51022 RepID=A0A0C2GXP2_9BILA|nr:hypothetical protein ANCDUO_05864 [Ancylostoma duodenale]
MMPKDTNYYSTMGSPFVSFVDLLQVNRHYNCSAELSKCPKEKQTKCMNNGFHDPRNCGRCICPGGYGGELCNKKPDDCGMAMPNAKNEWTTIELKTPNSNNDGKYKICTSWIQAEGGRRIEVGLVNITGGIEDSVGCDVAGIEIKAIEDQRLTGYR